MEDFDPSQWEKRKAPAKEWLHDTLTWAFVQGRKLEKSLNVKDSLISNASIIPEENRSEGFCSWIDLYHFREARRKKEDN